VFRRGFNHPQTHSLTYVSQRKNYCFTWNNMLTTVKISTTTEQKTSTKCGLSIGGIPVFTGFLHFCTCFLLSRGLSTERIVVALQVL